MGFEADLARALGKKLFGAPGHIELAQVTEDKRIEMLQADMVDMVLSQLTITPHRACGVERPDRPIDDAQGSGSTERLRVIDIGDRFDPKPFGVGVKKRRQSLVDRLNEAIDSLKASGDVERLMDGNVSRLAASHAINAAQGG